ncbi:MAG: DNA-processing protein DprA [Anaerolineae bacterium]|nr:DNA-processing protein DprA [Anaerolineae bacterium]MDW8101834.1 DNA-processing protein DprA [Anaerolineae bacterium]
MEELKYWLGFSLVKGIGPVRFRNLLEYFGNAKEAWEARPEELARAGLDRRSLENLLALRKRVSLEQEMEKLQKAGVRIVTWKDDDYPYNLRHIDNPPFLLFIKGTVKPQDEWAIAVVGTRRPSAYGKEATRFIVEPLARSGITIVSGLAKGIDGLAHQVTLEAGGRTIAVLGSGLDIIYPPEHKALAQAVAENGALISEYPLGTPPEAINFPPRNRIISGLAKGVLVVEAGETSGALITVEFALEQNREVFAVPGSIFYKTCRGTNRLIQQGAKLVISAEDILEELNVTAVKTREEVKAAVPATTTESLILSHLSSEPTHIDEIKRATGLPISEVSSALAIMEIKGLVRQVGGMHYVLARESKAEYFVD